ncbi:hypothetical protein ACFLS4_03220 [Bacteroidota bacterium]
MEIIPVIGTGKVEHIKNAVETLNIKMKIEQRYSIYTASTENDMP